MGNELIKLESNIIYKWKIDWLSEGSGRKGKGLIKLWLMDLKILSWNVEVWEIVISVLTSLKGELSANHDILCLQETKIMAMNDSLGGIVGQKISDWLALPS